MQYVLKYTLFFAISMIIFNCYADKKYTYAYDDNGNRITVSYISNCRVRDTTQLDTVPKEIIKEIKEVTTPSIYPNPTRAYFTLSFPDLTQLAKLEIYDLKGNLVFKEEQINTSHTIINTCNLAAGLYTVVVYYNTSKPFVTKIEKI